MLSRTFPLSSFGPHGSGNVTKDSWATQRERRDVLRDEEFKDMLKQLKGKDSIVGTYRVKLHGESVVQRFNIDCRMTECLLALLRIYGKRIMENLPLQRRDFRTDKETLLVNFFVLKKHTKSKMEARVWKAITLTHPLAHYVLDYIQTIKEPTAYVFPGRSKPREYSINRKFMNKENKEETKTYTYKRDFGGFMSQNKAWKTIKFLNPDAYNHLFRHSLATEIAEHGGTEDQLLGFFDWSERSAPIAHSYVKKGPTLIKDLTSRTW